MTSSIKHFCTICHERRIIKGAVTWCIECEVFFCGDCEKPHRSSRLYKNHKTMSVKDYQKLPTIIQNISSQCKDHKKQFELYCSFHACPCCVQCFSDKHKKCQDMKPLSDILKQVKSSASVQLFENDLKDVMENFDTVIKYMKTRISSINTQKTKAIEEIKHMRNSIDDYLNNLEQTILNDLESKHSKLKLNMTTLVQQMEQRASKIKQIQSEYTTMIQYATELQMYVGLREIEKTTSEAAKYIDDLVESGDHVSEKNLEVSISSALQSILHDVKSFGDIKINTTSSHLRVKPVRKDQAQHLLPNDPKIEQIKPSWLRTLTIPEERKTSLDVLACLVLTDGKFLILDNMKKQLLMFSNDGILIRKVLTFTQHPCGACFVRNNTVAVTLGAANQTSLVYVEKNKIIKTIKLSHYCNGVASDGKKLVISSVHEQTTTVNLNDMSRTILKGVEGVNSISLFKGNIYVTFDCENKVCCYNSSGEPLWTYQHQDIDGPVGITLDMNGFVYKVCQENNSIVVVSPDGNIGKTILSESNGIKRPWAIDINNETGLMIVSSQIRDDDIDTSYGTAFVYTI
ncbi:unnamed protein product [Mytilus coruscus]|uniref:B box-type domain-containing protein n=1 Tax=Mytilus coruscus TaxID=42192 RepID=A0A6J8C5Z3_MYTCO|nr:unnamed protein product [Mytilus coruscus]